MDKIVDTKIVSYMQYFGWALFCTQIQFPSVQISYLALERANVPYGNCIFVRSNSLKQCCGSGSYLDMFSMFSKINYFLWHFLTKSKHLMTLEIKDKIIILTKLYFIQKILYNEKIRVTRVFLWIKDPDPGNPKRPDPNTGLK